MTGTEESTTGTEGRTVVGNAIEPVSGAVATSPAAAARAAGQPKEAGQIVNLLDAALADQSLSIATRGHIAEARRIADEVVDGRTVSTEETTRKRRKAKSAKKSTAKKSARKTSSKRATTKRR